MTVMRKWSLLAAVLVAAVLAAGWFLLVSPKHGDAAALQEQTAAENTQISSLQIQIARLKEQAKDLPKLNAQLAVIHQQLPSDPQLPKLVRDLSTLSKTSGSALVSLAPSVPVAVNQVSAATGAAKPTTGAAAATTSTGLFQVPIVVKVSGSYFELEQFLNGVEGLRRAFLVSGVDIAPDTTSTSATGTPVTGQLEMSLTGRVFVVPPASATTTTTTPVAPATTAK